MRKEKGSIDLEESKSGALTEKDIQIVRLWAQRALHIVHSICKDASAVRENNTPDGHRTHQEKTHKYRITRGERNKTLCLFWGFLRHGLGLKYYRNYVQ